MRSFPRLTAQLLYARPLYHAGALSLQTGRLGAVALFPLRNGGGMKSFALWAWPDIEADQRARQLQERVVRRQGPVRPQPQLAEPVQVAEELLHHRAEHP